jgi:heme-degrading monooxygenase HmoA
MYVIVWKYEVLGDSEPDFRVAYGPDGDWARLFAKHDGYVATELIATDQPRQYFTIDRWASAEAFDAYMERDLEEYRRLDQRFDALTLSEELVGRGISLDSGTSGA